LFSYISAADRDGGFYYLSLYTILLELSIWFYIFFENIFFTLTHTKKTTTEHRSMPGLHIRKIGLFG